MTSAVQMGNYPECSNMELSVHKCRGVRTETEEDRVFQMSVQMFLRFVALVEEHHSLLTLYN